MSATQNRSPSGDHITFLYKCTEFIVTGVTKRDIVTELKSMFFDSCKLAVCFTWQETVWALIVENNEFCSDFSKMHRAYFDHMTF